MQAVKLICSLNNQRAELKQVPGELIQALFL